MNTNLEYPIRCISFYASNKSSFDKNNSFEWWMRGKLVRIIADKAFARGDILNITSITDNQNSIIIKATVDNGPYEVLPVLSFVSCRLVYNKNSHFEAITPNDIQIIKQIDQLNNNNYSIGFIILVFNNGGTIKVQDVKNNNYFDINCTLSWIN